jgi:hypothetical protein
VEKLINPKPQSVKRFYFFEYFYVLLQSIQLYSKEEEIFNHFMSLKHDYKLGESKYKKLVISDKFSAPKMARYRYTFNQVLTECLDYKLIRNKRRNSNEYVLNDTGESALNLVNKQDDLISFNRYIFNLMEERYNAFYYLINRCYSANNEKSGLLIFPIYSPLALGIEKETLKTSRDLMHYLGTLQNKIEQDIELHLGKKISLTKDNKDLINRLINAELLSKNQLEIFEPLKFNALLKRVRDYWISYFLRELYGYEYSNTSFEIWAYRGKQIGVLHATEFYPGFNGKIVYPLSILERTEKSNDFHLLHQYIDGKKLLIHEPEWTEKLQERFIDSLFNAYFDLRESVRSYFVNLFSVREIVCYNMKITEALFDEFLGNAYKLSLNRKLKRIRISLEVDKLPEETNAIYLKRAPVMVDGRYRNIIAIDRVS